MNEPINARRCSAHTSSGNPCRRAPIKGGTVCPSHGGRAPQVKAAAERRERAQALEADARAVLAFEAVRPVEDPVLELAELAAEVRATVRALGQRVNALQDPRYMSPAGTEQTRTELTVLGQYQDRLARMLQALAQFDLDDRRVRLNEATASILAHSMNRLLMFLALPPERDQAARAHVALIFRELDQAAAGGGQA